MDSEASSASARQAAEDLIRQRPEAVSRRDSAAVGALYAEDVVLGIPRHESGRTEAGAYRVLQGKAAVIAQFDMVRADGAAYRNRYVFRFDIADGKIRRVREYANPVTAALALSRPIGPE